MVEAPILVTTFVAIVTVPVTDCAKLPPSAAAPFCASLTCYKNAKGIIVSLEVSISAAESIIQLTP